MIPAYSPQARGRSEQRFSTWQGRLPQELRLHGVRTLEAASVFLATEYVVEFNRKFTFTASQQGSAFLPGPRRNTDLIFSQQFERTVGFRSLGLQIEPAEWRPTMAGCKVVIHQHLDATLTLTIAGNRVGHYSAQGTLLTPLTKKQVKAVKKTHGGKVKKPAFPPRLQIPQTTWDSHFPTASTTTTG
jgi:hypothetical protein